MQIGKFISSRNVKSLSEKMHDSWVRHFNSALRSGRLQSDMHEATEKNVYKVCNPPAIPGYRDKTAMGMMKHALKLISYGKRKQAAEIIMDLYDNGCEEIIKKAFKGFKQ